MRALEFAIGAFTAVATTLLTASFMYGFAY